MLKNCRFAVINAYIQPNKYDVVLTMFVSLSFVDSTALARSLSQDRAFSHADKR